MSHFHWQPSATIHTLRQRAQMIKNIRAFFNERGYLEVETPAIVRFGVTDVYLSPIQVTCRNEPYFLQTSPEYHMKRLLAAGSGPIFQLARVFRDDELGRWHNPEFSMLEWYQLNVDHHWVMDEVDALLQFILNCAPMKRKTVQEVFLDVCEIDPLKANLEALQQVLHQYGLQGVLRTDEPDRDQYLFLLMTHVIEPALAEEELPIAVYHFPASQAALAQIKNGVAERFEVYYRGVELANGFHELTDVDAQRARFHRDIEVRCERDLAVSAPDEYLLQAMGHGLPACSGVALGIDRLLALALEKTSVAEVVAFDFSRA